MDEIFPQKAFGVAISVLYAVAFIGFPLSMIAGSLYLSYYVTLSPPEGLSSDSKDWIGAWWLGMVIPAAIVFALSWILALFPRQMPAAKVGILHHVFSAEMAYTPEGTNTLVHWCN